MPFRIRNTDTETSEEYENCQKAYFEHLELFKKTSNGHLWKFFVWDFFHDGTIDSLLFAPDLRTLVMNLDCPNIQSFGEDGTYRYISVDFTCTFQNVIQFSIHDETPTEWGEHSDNPSKFLASEINTAIPDHLPGESDEFRSLVIESIGSDGRAWIELVFSQVDVVSKEPAAFAIMERDPRFKIPIYLPQA